MTKAVKGFLCGTAAIALLAFPACKSTKKTNPPATTTAASTDTGAPIVAPPPPPATDTTPTVEQHDFVNTDATVKTDELPNDIEELNRVAQQRGYVQDAFFTYNESTLSDEAQAALTASATWLKANGKYNLLIEGHCDERGTEQYNLALGDRRANTVKEYLQTLGVDASRIRTVSYGEERPFDAGHDEAAWAKNRRGHLVLVTR